MASTIPLENQEIAWKTLKIKLEGADFLGDTELNIENLNKKTIIGDKRYEFLSEIYDWDNDDDILKSKIGNIGLNFLSKELK